MSKAKLDPARTNASALVDCLCAAGAAENSAGMAAWRTNRCRAVFERA